MYFDIVEVKVQLHRLRRKILQMLKLETVQGKSVQYIIKFHTVVVYDVIKMLNKISFKTVV